MRDLLPPPSVELRHGDDNTAAAGREDAQEYVGMLEVTILQAIVDLLAL